jgi:hypothetical protein
VRAKQPSALTLAQPTGEVLLLPDRFPLAIEIMDSPEQSE